MNLTPQLKAKIVEQFKSGETIATISQWYGKPEQKIEQLIRESMNGSDISRKGAKGAKVMDLDFRADDLNDLNVLNKAPIE